MIRPLTLIGILVFTGTAGYLFQVKHAASLLDRELRATHRRIEAARERTQVLRAEWALLNEPERLRSVAQRHLALEPMTPQQFVRQADLARRLPPPAAFAGTPSLFAPPAGATLPAAEPAIAERAAEPITARHAAALSPARQEGAPLPARQAGAPLPAQQAGAPLPAQQAGAPLPARRETPSAPVESAPRAPAIIASAHTAEATLPAVRAADGFRPYTEILRAAEAQTGTRSATSAAARRPAMPVEPAVAAIAARPALAAVAPRPAIASAPPRAATFSALGTQRGSLPPPVPYGQTASIQPQGGPPGR